MKSKVIKSNESNKHLGLEEKVNRESVTSNLDLSSGDSGVLNKKVVDAKSKAQKIIDAAEKEALIIKKEAQSLLAQVQNKMEEQKKKGFDKGCEEGLASVTEKVIAFEKVKDAFYKNTEEDIIKLVMTISEKVIGKIVHEHSEAIKSIVKQAIESSLGDKIIVKLNSEDYKVIKEDQDEFVALLDRTQRLSLKEDESVEQGGCVVETEVGTIDARLETQLKAIRKALEL